MKRFFLWFFAIITTTAITQSAWAADYDFTQNGLFYKKLSATEVAVCSQKADYPHYEEASKPTGDITIPATITESGTTYNVTTLGDSVFADCKNITKITLSNTITEIKNSAFEGCIGLTSITLSKNVTSLPTHLFYGCISLKEVVVSWDTPLTASSLDIFTHVPLSAATLKVPAGKVDAYKAAEVWKDFGTITDGTATPPSTYYDFTQNGLFYKKLSATEVAVCPQKANAPYYEEASKPTGDITIPATITESGTNYNVTAIGEKAFFRCNGLTKVSISTGVTKIEDLAFHECSSLTSVSIPISVTAIGDRTFYGCTNLTSVSIPTSVTTIGNATFGSCSALTSISIPTSVTTIKSAAFEFSGLTSVTIPASVTVIERSAFGGCSHLTEILVATENTAYTSDEGILYDYEKTELIYCPAGKTGSISVPATVTTIGKGAFWRCTGLTSISIPTGVTLIESFAFRGCVGLTSVTIPNSLTTLKGFAFADCSSLAKVVVEWETPLTIDADVFSNVTLANITLKVPAGKVDAYKAAEVWKDFGTITDGTATPPSTYYDFTQNGLFYKKLSATEVAVVTENTSFPYYNAGNKPTGNIIIPFTVTNGTNNYTVTAIGEAAFANCNDITSVTIPNSVTIIGGAAFFGCNGITSVSIPDRVQTIGEAAFVDCTGLTSVTIPNSVTTIEKRAFFRCANITLVTIPNTTTIIGDEAFCGCTSLTEVTVKWETPLTIDADVFSNVTLSGITLKVPAGKVDAYKAAEVWKDFGTITDGTTTGGNVFRKDGLFYKKTSSNTVSVIPELAQWNSTTNSFYSTEANKPSGDISIPEQVTHQGVQYTVNQIEGNAFSGNCNVPSITIPKTVTTIMGKLAPYRIQSIRVADENPLYKSIDGVLYTKNGRTLLCYPSEKPGKSFTIPAGVTTIGDGAFRSCLILQNITLPTGLTTIRSGAFFTCNLKSIVIPVSVTTIGGFAFSGCNNLKEVTVQWATPLSINPSIFANSPIRTATLKVPAGKKALYQADPVWKDFGTITDGTVAPPTPAAELTVTPEKVNIIQKGESKSISVTSNTDWTATSSEEWLTLSSSSGTNDGRVTATATANTETEERTATVTFTAGNKTRTVTFTQKGKPAANTLKTPESVELNKSEVSLMVGAQIQLSDTVRPIAKDVDRRVTWSSSNTNIATVDNNGLVTAVAKGQAVITVQTKVGGFKASCNVTVSKQDAIVIPPPAASPVPDTDKENIVTLSLTVPTDQGFTLSFVLNLPKGLVLDQKKTKLAKSLIDQYTLKITPEGSGWKFEIKPNMLRKAGDHFVVREMVHVAYTADKSVKKGNHDAQVKELNLTFTDGSTITKKEIPFKVTVHTTTSNELIEANMHVWTAGGRLYVDSPSAETVEIYTFGGTMLFRTVKPAGQAVYDIALPQSVMIVRGSSGWTRKVRNQ